MSTTSTFEDEKCREAAPGQGGHNLTPMDPDNPMMWPFAKKLYTSSVAWFFAFVV
jgi:hypothetical protein